MGDSELFGSKPDRDQLRLENFEKFTDIDIQNVEAALGYLLPEYNWNCVVDYDISVFGGHKGHDLDGYTYNIPREKGLNLVSAVTLSLMGGIPYITMLQRVKAEMINEVADDFNIKIYSEKTHPLSYLFKGEGRIKWEQSLIKACKVFSKEMGYIKLRMISGFFNRHVNLNLTKGFTLGVVLGLYDRNVMKDSSWIPVMRISDGREVILDRAKVIPIVNSIVSGRKSGEEHVYAFTALSDYFSDDQPPTLWEKNL